MLITKRYKVFNYLDSPRPWEFYMVLGEIEVDSRRYFIVHDNTSGERYIREFIPAAGNGNGGLKDGNILASIESDELWMQLLQIAKKEGIVQ